MSGDEIGETIFKAQGSGRQGSRLRAQGSRLKAQGSRLRAQGIGLFYEF